MEWIYTDIKTGIVTRPRDEKKLSESQKKGLDLLERVVAEAPQFRDAWLGRGQILLCLGELHRARESFRRVIALDPRAVEGYLGLAHVSHEAGNEKESKEELRNALAAINLRIAESAESKRNWS